MKHSFAPLFKKSLISLAVRADLLAKKARGHLPNASWYLILSLLPRSYITRHPIIEPRRIELQQPESQPCSVLWETMFGSFWGREDDKEELHFIVREQYDNIYQKGPVKIREGDIVFDVGGHLGVFTRVALDRGASKVVIIEPELSSTTCLQKTFAKEISNGQVVLIKSAVWSETGVLNFSGASIGFHYESQKDQQGTIPVPATTIDAIAEELDLKRVDFIKMDIEGSERYALTGAKQVLKKYGPRLAIASYHLPDDKTVLPDIILKVHPSYRRYITSHNKECIYFH